MKGPRRTQPILFSILSALLLSVAPSSHAQPVNSLPQPSDYVSDFAHVLSPRAIAQLDSICDQLDHSQANTQIAVVTVQSLSGADAADYANQLEDKWRMGRKGSDKGLLVLLAVDDHKYRIDVGYGLEGILNDARVGDIGREMVPYLHANDYDSAISLAVSQIAQIVATDAQITLQNPPAVDHVPVAATEPAPRHYPVGVRILQITVFAVFVICYLLRILGSFGLLGAWGLGLMTGGIVGEGRGGSGGGWGKGGGGFSGGGGGGFGGFGGGGFGGGGAGGSW